MSEEFDKSQIVDLDECVLGALTLFAEQELPILEIPFKRPLVVGSGNAAVVGKIIARDTDAIFADESNFKQKLKSSEDIDGALLISASGSKHAPMIAKALGDKGIKTILLTNNPEAPAKEMADKTNTYPKQPEPYTYNTSTYMGMILSQTKEDPKAIHQYLIEKVKSLIPTDLSKYNAYCIIIPDEFDGVKELFLTKFDELFGPMINGRVFTVDQMKHAKTVTTSEQECFISLGFENTLYGKNKIDIPLIDDTGYGAMMAIGYYIIGHIQKQNKPWFKDNIEEYCKLASKLFGEKISPFVG